MISGLIRSYYITSSVHKISPIHQFILDKADFRIPGPKRSRPYSTLYIYPELLTFLTPMSMQKKEKISSIIHSFLRYSRAPMTLKATHIFDHVHPITIKVTFNFPEHVLACNMSARLVHSFKD